jgi:hypothetical protein
VDAGELFGDALGAVKNLNIQVPSANIQGKSKRSISNFGDWELEILWSLKVEAWIFRT